MSEKSLKELAYDERCDLADFLETLTAPEWHTDSLCAGWSVKDVVAHVISYEELNVAGLVKRFGKGRIVRANEVGVEEFSHYSPEELLAFLRRHLHPRGLTAGFGGMIAFVDGTIHHQDIRRALGHRRILPAERLERILPLVPRNPRLGAGRRIKGLRLEATDVDFSHGEGPAVYGPGEALLMAMSGRRDALNELAGPGHVTLAGRM